MAQVKKIKNKFRVVDSKNTIIKVKNEPVDGGGYNVEADAKHLSDAINRFNAVNGG